jgi:hypothetical protein
MVDLSKINPRQSRTEMPIKPQNGPFITYVFSLCRLYQYAGALLNSSVFATTGGVGQELGRNTREEDLTIGTMIAPRFG